MQQIAENAFVKGELRTEVKSLQDKLDPLSESDEHRLEEFRAQLDSKLREGITFGFEMHRIQAEIAVVAGPEIVRELRVASDAAAEAELKQSFDEYRRVVDDLAAAFRIDLQEGHESLDRRQAAW